MTMTVEQKKEIIGKFARAEGDTGSPEVQIAILTTRITELTDHLRTHKKDHHSRRGLIGMVNNRNSLLKFLRKSSHERYTALVSALNLRAKLD